MAHVSIHYGPYEVPVCGTVAHRTFRLRGLKEQLELRGHTVELIPSPHWDRVEVELGRRHVFRCRVTSLEFDTDGEDDAVCQRAVAVVEDHVARVRQPPAPAQVPLFSEEYFEQAVAEAFREVNLQGYISSCFSKYLHRIKVLEGVEFSPAVEAKLQAEFQGLEGGLINNLLQREFVEDLSQEKIENFLQEEGGLKDALEHLSSKEVSEYTNVVIRKTIAESNDGLHRIIEDLVSHVVEGIVNELAEKNDEEHVFNITAMVEEATKRWERISTDVDSKRSVINELIDKVSYNQSWNSKQSRIWAEKTLQEIASLVVQGDWKSFYNQKLETTETETFMKRLITSTIPDRSVDLQQMVADVVNSVVETAMFNLGLGAQDARGSQASEEGVKVILRPGTNQTSYASVVMDRMSLNSLSPKMGLRVADARGDDAGHTVEGVKEEGEMMEEEVMDAFGPEEPETMTDIEDIVHKCISDAMAKLEDLKL